MKVTRGEVNKATCGVTTTCGYFTKWIRRRYMSGLQFKAGEELHKHNCVEYEVFESNLCTKLYSKIIVICI